MAASMRRAKVLTDKANVFLRAVTSNVFAKPNVNTNVRVSEVNQKSRYRCFGSSEAAASCAFCETNARYQSSMQSDNHHVCWNCNHRHSCYALFCEECTHLQEPEEDTTYFDIMGLPQRFKVNVASLSKKFRQLQNLLHPDKFINKSKKEKQLSERHSACVNKAYRTLLKPIPRGLYLLKLHGYPLEEGETEMDPDFLSEIMEVNEAIFEASDLNKVRQIDERNKVVLDDMIDQVSSLFEAGDFQKAKRTLAKLKYYANIDDKVKEIERRYMDHLIGQ